MAGASTLRSRWRRRPSAAGGARHPLDPLLRGSQLARGFASGLALAQYLLVDLADARLRDLRDEGDAVGLRHRVLADAVRLDVAQQVLADPLRLDPRIG